MDVVGHCFNKKGKTTKDNYQAFFGLLKCQVYMTMKVLYLIDVHIWYSVSYKTPNWKRSKLACIFCIFGALYLHGLFWQILMLHFVLHGYEIRYLEKKFLVSLILSFPLSSSLEFWKMHLKLLWIRIYMEV